MLRELVAGLIVPRAATTTVPIPSTGTAVSMSRPREGEGGLGACFAVRR